MSSNVNTNQSMVMTGKDNQKTLSDILDLLSSYKTLIDDLKQRIQL